MSLVARTPLRDVVTRVSTWNPQRSQVPSFDYIDLSAIDQTRKTIVEVRNVPTAEAPSRARQIVRAGDVLVSTVRPNLNGVALVPDEFDGATASTGFCVLRATEKVESGYLFHWVRSPEFVADMVGKATGASYPAVTDRIIYESTIPLPTLEEQRRIAKALDRVDELRTKRRQALAYLDELTQSIFLDMFGDPVLNRLRWPRVPMSSLLRRIHSGHSPQCLDRPVGHDEWGVLKLGAVTSCEYLASENKALPPGVAPRPEHEVRTGDLLFSRKNTRELVGACALVRATPPRLLLPDLIFRLEPAPEAEIDTSFLHRLLTYPSKRRQIQALAGGSAGSMPNISKAKLMAVDVELPPLSIQRDFARRVEGVESLKLAQRAQLAELDALFASVHDRAFKGLL